MDQKGKLRKNKSPPAPSLFLAILKSSQGVNSKCGLRALRRLSSKALKGQWKTLLNLTQRAMASQSIMLSFNQHGNDPAHTAKYLRSTGFNRTRVKPIKPFTSLIILLELMVTAWVFNNPFALFCSINLDSVSCLCSVWKDEVDFGYPECSFLCCVSAKQKGSALSPDQTFHMTGSTLCAAPF